MTAAVQDAPPTRRVRITIDAEARELATRSNMLRVFTSAGPLILLTDAAEVTVEDVQAERVWTDGDVVQVHAPLPYVAHREDGKWLTTQGGLLEDEHMDLVLADKVERVRATVLRYQHGGDA